jgi:cephalosporin hydroxylase
LAPKLDAVVARRLAQLAARTRAFGERPRADVERAVAELTDAVASTPRDELDANWQRSIADAFRRLYDRDLDTPPPPIVRDAIVEAFHRLYYHDPSTWRATRWMGTVTWKCPLDLWLYQEMLHELRPALVVETGTAFGGSACYLAQLCDLVGTGAVVSIDVEDRPDRPQHPRLTYLHGSSTDPDVVARVAAMAADGGPVLVILDSDHSAAHVHDELQAYADLVTVGSYLVVEDTNVNGHPAFPDHGPGPMEAVDRFLAQRDDFVVDETKHRFHMTFNPRGFLKKRG